MTKSIIKRVIFRFIKPLVTYIHNSNSQAGEDRILDYLFASTGMTKITYIDIGANDPVGSNNTYLFYTRQNTGILVEPDASHNGRIRSTRPNDLVLNAAVSYGNGHEADFYVFEDSALNTLSKEEANSRALSGKHRLAGTTKIRLVTIENIIEENLQGKLPELISLDVEGLDYDILSSFDFDKYPVPVWVVETCAYSENHIKPKVKPIIALMQARGYFAYADTYINTVFVRTSWFEHYQES